MKIEQVLISKLQFQEKNVRIHPQSQIDEIKRSITQFGQYKPIIIDENNKILAGNGFTLALQQMGEKHVLAYRISNLTENQKKKLLIVDNRIFELGTSDTHNLFKLVKELQLEGDLDLPGYSEELLNDLVGNVSVDDIIKNYGDITGDRELEMQQTSKELEERISSNPYKYQEEIAIENKNIEIDDKNGVRKPYIKCSKCGETIWL
jgi:ParB-like chromosome segregation protein Spo0J